MSKVIICIHGLGNKPKKKLLVKWWRKSILEGLRGIGNFFFRPKIKMVYWADLLHDRPLDEKNNDTGSPYYLEEKYVKAPKDYKPGSHLIRKKFLDFIERQIDRLILNEDQSINYSFISDYIIHKYFHELEIYYKREYSCHGKTYDVRELIRKRLIDILNRYKNDEIFLIAHSMGSIIAYDVLLLEMSSAKVNIFATMGSPLGLPVIIGKTASEYKKKFNINRKLSTPDCVTKNWYNFSDLEDKVAMNYNLADDYEANEKGIRTIDFIVINNYIINGKKNPHKSYGYLRTPEFSKILLEFLISGRSNFAKRLINLYNNSYSVTVERVNKLFNKIFDHLKREKK